MNAFYQKHSEWLIPVLCVLVIFQTVMLVSDDVVGEVGRQVSGLPVVEKQLDTVIAQKTVAQIQLVLPSAVATVGKPLTVEAWLTPNKAITLGGMDVVLQFDPKMVGITKIETDKIFSLALPNRQSEKNGRLFITYLDEKGDGVVIDKKVRIMSLTVTPKTTGNIVLSVVSGAQGATTVLAEKASSQALPFTANDLVVTVSEK